MRCLARSPGCTPPELKLRNESWRSVWNTELTSSVKTGTLSGQLNSFALTKAPPVRKRSGWSTVTISSFGRARPKSSDVRQKAYQAELNQGPVGDLKQMEENR